MTTPIPECPSCAGPQMVDHPGGQLEFDHDPLMCALRVFEDQTKAADRERADDFYLAAFVRASTPTELVLLAAIGYTVPAGGLDCTVSYLTPGVRNRTWPDLTAPVLPDVDTPAPTPTTEGEPTP